MGAKPGHEVSPETRAKISAALRGKPNGRLGYETPAETRAKISVKLTGRTLSAETRAKMTASRSGTKSSKYKGDAATKEAKHIWLVKYHPKSGRCEECGETAETQYAFKHHPGPYTRNREDYRELCDPCHRTYDYWMRNPATRPSRAT
jgi:hypothetical protein